MIGVINDIASLILVPVLTVLLVLVLIVLIAPKKSHGNVMVWMRTRHIFWDCYTISDESLA